MLIRRLRDNFCSSTVEDVADEVIKTQSDLAFRDLNSTLNAWRRSWDHRKFHDPQSDGRTFSADPLPFWDLAKLLIVLYLNPERHDVHDLLRVPVIHFGDMNSKTASQEKVFSWLKTLRDDPGEEDWRSLLASGGDNSRVLLLTRPLC